MKIRFNNFFKFKKKKVNEEKEHVLKVYSGGGKIIKYEPMKVSSAAEIKRTRKGAKNFDSGGNTSVPLKKHVYEEQENKKLKTRQKDKNRSAYLLFVFMLVLAGYSLFFSYNRYQDLNEEDYAVYNSQDVEVEVVIPEEQSSVSNNLDATYVEKVVETSSKTTSTNTAQVKKVQPLQFAKPIEGEILKIYSSDKVIYSKTLELWKTHDGIDIKADVNTVVKAIEKGTVEKVYDDSFYGKTIVIDHGQGYKSSYSNLSDDVFVKEKQVVTKLAKIGKVGTTAIGEIKDEPHLHFMLIKNNEICDPSSIFY